MTTSVRTDHPAAVDADEPPPRMPTWLAALSGVLAAGAALAAAELTAALVNGARSPVTSIGTAVIDLAPPGVKDVAIDVFGTADKAVLIGGVLLVLALFAAALGVVAARRRAVGVAGVLVLGGVGAVAALTDPSVDGIAGLLPAVAAAAAGVVALLAIHRRWDSDAGSAATDTGRRGVLRVMALVAVGAAVAGTAGRLVGSAARAAASAAGLTLPEPDQPASPLPGGADLGVDGLTSFTTPNADFYRIDTALQVPAVAVDTWRLEVKGMVDRPLSLSYDDLLAYDLVEADVTLACVSNEVGGGLVGNARWLGVRIGDVLADAGVSDGADQLVGRAVDGFTAGAPTDVVLDGRESLIAVGMNGEVLPPLHGFPARLVVPGLYGYVSATKWLAELELTTFDAFDAYWIPRGWAARAPVKTQSRIDVPKGLANLMPGTMTVAGVAWAQTRGIDAVEVRVDEGQWQSARLSEPVGKDTWRQWTWDWQAEPGQHRLEVRATDGDGQEQTDERVPPRPDGATGWHSVVVSVSDATTS